MNRIVDIIPRLTDIYDIDSMKQFDGVFMKHNINTIIHLSGMYIKGDSSSSDRRKMDAINVNLPYRLLQSACKYGVKNWINTGTFFEYTLSSKKPISEQSKKHPYNHYAQTKINFEAKLKNAVDKRKISAVTLKLFSPYGELDNDKIIPLIIKANLLNTRIFLTKGSQKLAFTYVADIVTAYWKSISLLNKKKIGYYNDFNIGNTHSYSIRQIVTLIENITHNKNRVTFGKIKNLKDEDAHVYCDSTKAKSILGWQAKTGIVKGIKKTYQSYKLRLV